MTAGAWMSKTTGRTAHYVEDGRPVCAALADRSGEPLLAEFKRRFTALRAGERRCYLCRRVLQRREAEPAEAAP